MSSLRIMSQVKEIERVMFLTKSNVFQSAEGLTKTKDQTSEDCFSLLYYRLSWGLCPEKKTTLHNQFLS